MKRTGHNKQLHWLEMILVPGNGNSVKRLGTGSYFPPDFFPKVSVKEDDHFLFPSQQGKRFLNDFFYGLVG
jgi:hypothetical protein